jgi:hypothetical protein
MPIVSATKCHLAGQGKQHSATPTKEGTIFTDTTFEKRGNTYRQITKQSAPSPLAKFSLFGRLSDRFDSDTRCPVSMVHSNGD